MTLRHSHDTVPRLMKTLGKNSFTSSHDENLRIAPRRALGMGGITLLCIILLWAAAVRSPSPLARLMNQSWDLGLTEYQILALPLIVMLLVRLRLGAHRASPIVLALGMIGALVAVWFSYAPVTTASHIALIAPLGRDELETDATKLREAINQAMDREEHYGKLEAIRYHAMARTQREASKILSQSEDAHILVWGDTRLIRISFPQQDQIGDPALSAPPAQEPMTGLRLVTSIPLIALSYQPQADTAAFIAKLSAALSLLDAGPKAASNALLQLADVGSMAATWRSFAHRSYPWWISGNLSLQAALTSSLSRARSDQLGADQLGALECALDAYDKARSYLRFGDNPELLAAILNNRAVALYTKGVYLGKPLYRSLALKNLSAATDTLKHPNLFGIKYRVGKIALMNTKTLSRKGFDYGFFRSRPSASHSRTMKKHKNKHARVKKHD